MFPLRNSGGTPADAIFEGMALRVYISCREFNSAHSGPHRCLSLEQAARCAIFQLSKGLPHDALTLGRRRWSHPRAGSLCSSAARALFDHLGRLSKNCHAKRVHDKKGRRPRGCVRGMTDAGQLPYGDMATVKYTTRGAECSLTNRLRSTPIA